MLSETISKKENHINKEDSSLFKHLYKIPPKTGRYIVLDTETTGLNLEDHVVELGAHEILNGKLTGAQFHIYIKPRIKMSDEVINIHGITNEFYDDYYNDIYMNDKNNIINFLKWVGSSLIFAHNSSFDMSAINVELKNWGINEIPEKKFRCSMKMFKEVVGKIDHRYYDKYVCLDKCCEYFDLKSNINSYHNALFDAFMTARMICKLYELIETDTRLKVIRQKIRYNPNSFKNYNFMSNNLSNNDNQDKFKMLNKKTKRENDENIPLVNKGEDEGYNEKIMAENLNNNTESTSSNESIEKNNNGKEKNEFSDEIIDEIFNEL